MRKTNSLTLETENLGTLEIKVYEVRPFDLLDIHKEIQNEGKPIGEYERLLPLCCNLTREQLATLYPSEMEQVISSFKDANKSFLAPWPTIKTVIEKIGLGDWLADVLKKSGLMEKVKMVLSSDLQKVSVSLPREATANPNSTDGGTSELP
jgi:hypothetical protein